MTTQRSVAARDAANEGYSTTLGTSGITLEIGTGDPPVNCAASNTGTLLALLSLPSSPLAASSGGVIAKSGAAWSGTAVADGVAGHYRLKKTGGACVEQGTCAKQVSQLTTAVTAANGNVLTFGSTPAGVVASMKITGTGVPTRATVIAVVGSTVVMSATSVPGVASGASITFSGDMVLDNTNIANGQSVIVATYQQTMGDA